MQEHIFKHGSEDTIIETTRGKVQGYEYDGVRIFKGIPYAKAQRFHAPEPTEPWEGVMDATNYGYVCPLMNAPMPFGELANPHRYWIENENCQNLNIWTPSGAPEKLPVLVWLHGGGFTEGSSIEQLAYEGENMSRFGHVVVVSLNHRINILGFCDLSDFGEEYANSANAGMDDIIAALKWIRENIEQFGGDPGNVTLLGQSGGGEKISALLQMPEADGLYHKGVIMSGVLDPGLEDNQGSGRPLIEAMLEELQTEDVKVLETIPFRDLVKVYQKVSPKLKAEGKYVGQVPNPNKFYAGMPLGHGFRKETAHIPLMVGGVFGEMNTAIGAEAAKKYREERKLPGKEQAALIEALIGKDAAHELIREFEKAYPDRAVTDLHYADMVFRLPSKKFIDMRRTMNTCTYSYMFNQDLPLNGGSAPWHCTDIPFMFHNTELVPVTQVPGVTRKLEEQMFKSLIAFAASGNPDNDTIPHWPSSDDENENVMIFDSHTRMIPNNDTDFLISLKKNFGYIYGSELDPTMKFLFGDKWMNMWK